MLRRLRPALFWLHLVIGVAASLVVIMLCVTGALLAAELPVTRWADRQLVSSPAPGAAPLSLEALAPHLEAGLGDRAPSHLTLGRDPADPVVASVSRRRVVFDPFTGASLGGGAVGVRGFFHGVMKVHRWFALEGGARGVGKAVVGAATLGFVALVLTGLVLWVPRRWRWSSVRPIFWFRRGKTGKARDHNWHHVLGLWLSLPLLFLAVTGAGIAYAWVRDGLVALGGETEASARPASRPADEDASLAARLTGVDAAVARVVAREPDWRQLTLTVPGDAESSVVITADHGNGRQPQHRVSYEVDRRTLELVRHTPWEDEPSARRIRGVIRFGHTGEMFGLLGMALAALVSVGGAVLGFTGVTLSWHRFVAWRRRRQRSG